MRFTLIPETLADDGLPPVANTYRPNLVLYSTMKQMTRTTIKISTGYGRIPTLPPPIFKNPLLSPGTGLASLAMKVTPLAILSIPSVAINAGTFK